MSKDYVHNLKRIGSGPGNLFIGPLNTVVEDPNSRGQFHHVGACKGGGEIAFIAEDFDTEAGEPMELLMREISKLGITLKVSLLEPTAFNSIPLALGHGDTREVNAYIVTLTNQEVRLYGNNIQKLPYRNVTITSIKTSDATPTTFTAEEIAAKFEINSTLGTIKAKSGAKLEGASEDFDADPDFGTLLYYDGTWARPEQTNLRVGNVESEEKDFHSVLYLATNKDSLETGIFIPKAYTQGVETIPCKVGENRVVGFTFRSAKSPTLPYQWEHLDDVD